MRVSRRQLYEIRTHASGEMRFKQAEGLIGESKPIADAVLKSADDPDSHVQFQASLTLGDVKDARTLPVLARLAHERSTDSWFRIAILSSRRIQPLRFTIRCSQGGELG